MIIRLIVKLIRSMQKPALDIAFKLEDVTLESFRKKSFVTFDLYVQNIGRRPIEISRIGFVMADGSEKTFYQEPHVIKTPDRSVIGPGEEAFFDDCDLFYCLNERPPYYKKITGLFADIRDLFAKTPAANMRGYGPGRFSFNVRGGRCDACDGDGVTWAPNVCMIVRRNGFCS